MRQEETVVLSAASSFNAQACFPRSSCILAVILCLTSVTSLASTAVYCLTVSDSITLGPGENKITSFALNGATLYAGMNTFPAIVARINTVSMRTAGPSLKLSDGENSIYSLLVVDGYLYAGLYTSPGRIVKIDTGNFSKVGTLTLREGENWITCLAASDGFLYAGLRMFPGKIVKINLRAFQRVSLLELAPSENNVFSMAIKDGYLYANIAMRPGGVAKIKLETFQEVQSLRLRPGEDYCYVLAISDNLLFSGLYSKPAGIAKIDLTTFEQIGSAAQFLSGEDNVWSLIVHQGFVYAGLDSRPGRVLRFDRDLKRLDALSFNEEESAVYALLSLNESLICGLFSSPGRIAVLQTQTMPSQTEYPLLTHFAVLSVIVCIVIIGARRICSARKSKDLSPPASQLRSKSLTTNSESSLVSCNTAYFRL